MSKYIECCEILTAFSSYNKNNKLDDQEADWFARFSFSFLTVLAKNDKLCLRCNEFYSLLKQKVDSWQK